jgi:dUTPase
MLMSGEAIQARNILTNAEPQNYRNASYDLRIGKILTLAGEEVEEYIMPPQGMAEVISIEKVAMPDDVAGYALVRTTLCNQGILAINIGIIDPGYSGLISSTLINFSKSPFVLRSGDIFLRLTFQEYRPQPQVRRRAVGDAEYLADKRDKVNKHFSERFLDIKKTAEEVAKPVTESLLEEWKKRLLIWVPVFAATFAVLSFLVNWGATWSARWMLVGREQLKSEVVTELRIQQATGLEERVRSLEERLRQLASPPSPTRPPVPPLPTRRP